MVLLYRIWRSEKAGWILGSNLELQVNSVHLRNLKVARMNRALSNLAVSSEW